MEPAKKQEINLLKALMEVEEKERVRIAQDLHDGIVVQFTAAKMNVCSLTNHYKTLADSTAFKQAVEQLYHATRNLRQTTHNLLPNILLLTEAVYYFCKNIKQTPGLKIDFQLYGQIPRLAPDFELSVYRIIQELTHNVIKHAQAKHALAQITCKDQHLSIIVEDDNIGIPPAFLNNQKGIGLRSIHIRGQTLQGHIDVRSHPNNGTTVYIEFNMQHSLTPLSPHMTIRTAILDNHPMTIHGVQAILQPYEDIYITATYTSGKMLLDKIPVSSSMLYGMIVNGQLVRGERIVVLPHTPVDVVGLEKMSFGHCNYVL